VTGDQQAPGGLDGHRDGVFGGVAVLGEHLQEVGQTVGVVVDAGLVQ
jgi:hypothetical protein